jgi:YHS domain-containing protein
MRKLIILSSMILVSLSACQKSEPPKPAAKPAFNEVCPVSGEPVNPKSKTVEHEGKVYGFCCNSCEPKFKADPAKYSAKVSADGKTFLGEKEPMH